MGTAPTSSVGRCKRIFLTIYFPMDMGVFSRILRAACGEHKKCDAPEPVYEPSPIPDLTDHLTLPGLEDADPVRRETDDAGSDEQPDRDGESPGCAADDP